MPAQAGSPEPKPGSTGVPLSPLQSPLGLSASCGVDHMLKELYTSHLQGHPQVQVWGRGLGGRTGKQDTPAGRMTFLSQDSIRLGH